MSLKPVVDALDGVPEGVRDSYVERDGKFHLSVEGMVPKDRLDEFRNNNVTLKRQIEELTSRFDGVDPDQFRELSAKAQKERDKKLIDAGKVDELVAERVAAMRSDFDKQLGDLTAREQAANKQLESLLIDGAIRDNAMKAGVRPTAIDDVLLRGRSVFRLQDGKPIPMDGDKPIYGKSGDPMGIDEWVGSLTDRAPHLFEPSQGGGSKQGAGARPSTPGRIAPADNRAFLQNLDKIASGEIKVG